MKDEEPAFFVASFLLHPSQRLRSFSIFAPLSSAAFRAVSWSNPFLSGAVLAAATTLYLSFYSFNSTLLGLASTLVVIALGLSGLETLYNNHNVAQQLPVQGLPAKLPTLALPVNSGSIEGLFAAMGAAVVSFLEMLNGHLTWQSPSESIKALGYAWLVMRFAALLTPGWLLFYALLSFVVAPLYLLNQPMVDSAFTTQVLPQLKKVAHTITSTQTAALHWLKTNQPVALIGGAVSGALLLYFAWGAVSFSGLFTTAALTRATLDAVLALADTTSSATGASRND